jgi:hypothetical protein
MTDDKNEKTVEVELLVDGMRIGDVDHVRGDVVRIPEANAKRLEELGAVGSKGTHEKRRKAADAAAERDARQQRILTGLEPVEAADTGEGQHVEQPAKSAARASR